MLVIYVGETVIITVIVSPGVTGNVTVIVNGKSETEMLLMAMLL